METLISALVVLFAVIVLLGLSGLISHLFGLDHFYTESLKEQNPLDLSGLRRIDQKHFISNGTHLNQTLDNLNQGLQNSDS